MQHRASLVLILGVAAAAATAQSRGPMDLIPPSELAGRWILSGTPTVAPYPQVLAHAGSRPACVNLGFAIGRDGTTRDFAVLRAWAPTAADAPSRRRLDLFAQSAAAAVSRWRFAPADAAGVVSRRPVFTSAIFVFGAGPAGDPATAARCGIDDFREFVTEAQARVARRGSLHLGRLDRKRVSDPVVIPDGMSPDHVSRHPGWGD